MKAVVLISGFGTNLQAIIDNADDIGITIAAVISNSPDAYGIKRAQKANIKTKIVTSKNVNVDIFNNNLLNAVAKYNPKIILLAGFMRILAANFIEKYNGIILNIHPSLLPKFKGLNTHLRAIAEGVKTHGATVHLVTNKLDSGEIIMQKSIAVLASDDEKSLAKRVLKIEHILYPQAIKSFIKKKYK